MNFKVDQGPEGIEVELPALELIHKLGYDYKSNAELKIEKDNDDANWNGRNVLLYGRLRKAIKSLNDLDDDEVNEAINQIHERNFARTLDPVDTNERIHILLTGKSQANGLVQPIQVKSIDAEGNPIDKDVKLFDFKNVDTKNDKNNYLVTNQFRVNGIKNNFIECDIVVFVNGIPLVIIECKKPTSLDYLQDAFDQNFDKYQERGSDFSRLFFYNHLMIATQDIHASYGTLQSGPNYYSKWTNPDPTSKDEIEKQNYEELKRLCNRTPSAQDILLSGILNKKNLLGMLENFVMYQTIGGKRVKLVAKHQQFNGVTKLVKKMEEIKYKLSQPHSEKELKEIKKGGVVWHTQGSGKSFTMIWFATQLVFKFKNPAIMILTDRKQLDKQIKENFEKAGYATKVSRAKSAKHLDELLKNPQGLTITTTVQKFLDRETGFKVEPTNKQIIVLADEAHRTQYGFTAADMRNVLPNGIFFGFTGTPISKDKESRVTVNEFGDVIDKYSFMQAINDGVTLPVRHYDLLPDVYIDGPETLDEIFDRVFKDLDKETKAKLKQRYGDKGAIAEAPERIKKICHTIVKHYKSAIEPDGFKAMIVATSQEAAVVYKRQLDRICDIPSKIIMSSGLNEKGKDGLSWDEFYLSDSDKEKAEVEFTKSSDPTKILIVVDMLLTGFDCPILKVMYLDKSIKEHTLLQAIARVNRVYTEQKKSGDIVDFIGVTKDLGKAFANYEATDMVGALDTLDTDLRKAKEYHLVILDHIKDLRGKDNSDKLLAFQGVTKQEQFAYDFKMFSKAVDELLPNPEAKEFIDDLKFAGEIQAMIRADWHGDKPRIKQYGAKVQQIIDDHIKSLGISEMLDPTQITPSNFGVYVKKYNEKAQGALVSGKARVVIGANRDRNPGFFDKLSKKLEALIADEKARRIDTAEYLKKCEFLLEESVSGIDKKRKELGLNEFELAVFENLTVKCDDEKICLDSTKEISKIIILESKIKDWREKEESKNIMYFATYDTLDSKIFSEEIRDKLALEHIEVAKTLL